MSKEGAKKGQQQQKSHRVRVNVSRLQITQVELIKINYSSIDLTYLKFFFCSASLTQVRLPETHSSAKRSSFLTEISLIDKEEEGVRGREREKLLSH